MLAREAAWTSGSPAHDPRRQGPAPREHRKLAPHPSRCSHPPIPSRRRLRQLFGAALAAPRRRLWLAPAGLACRPGGVPAGGLVPLSYCEFAPWCASIRLNQRASSRNHHRIGQVKLTIPKGRTRCEAGVQSHGSRACGTTGLPKAEEPRSARQPAPEAPGAGSAVPLAAWLT